VNDKYKILELLEEKPEPPIGKQELTLRELENKIQNISDQAALANSQVLTLKDKLVDLRESERDKTLEEAMVVFKQTQSDYERILDLLVDLRLILENIKFVNPNAELEREVLEKLKARLS